MKKTSLLFLLAATVFLFPACKKSNTAPANVANIMFIHGCAAGATTVNLDGRINGTTVNGASNIQFLKHSGYLVVNAATNATLSFFVTGLNQLDAATVNINANSRYSAFASGSITQPGIVYVTDDLAAPASGKAKVRFVNLSPDGLMTSCYVGTTKIDSNVGYKACTPFYEVAATTTTKVSMIDQVVLSNSGVINSQVLAAGKIYTFIFTGTATGSGSSLLTLTAINNN